MWPRLAIWAVSLAALPAAKWVWSKILEQPSYVDEVAQVNRLQAAKEEAEKEELERLRNQLSKVGQKAHDDNPKDLLFKKF